MELVNLNASAKTAAAVAAFLMVLLPGTALAWSGDPWASITRAQIKATADLMIDSTWVPKNTFTNWEYTSSSSGLDVYHTYYKGTTYTGVAYSQSNPQDTWSEFSGFVSSTAGGSQRYGNDCSGFASICWKLPARKTTYYFESQLGTYWTSLGAIGSAATAPLLMGDALNSSSVGHIVLFLNFESTGVRTMEQTPHNAQRKLRSFSNLAEYRPIRRLQISDAPSLAVDGLSKVVDAGNAVSFSVTAAGTAPFSYRWTFNGNTIAGATTSKLSFTSAQLTNAGNYACIVTNTLGGVTSRVMALTVYPPQATVFLDTFDTNSAAQWLLNRSSADTRAVFSYDYAAMGIPSAPRSTGGTTRGLRLEANMTAGAVAAVSLSPANASFAGDYRLRFDLWMNANGPFPAGGTGSSQHATAGLGTAGNRVQWTGSGAAADGFWFAVDGEGQASDTASTSGDFCAFAGASLKAAASGVYAAGTNSTAKGNLDPYYVAAFPTGKAAPTTQQAAYAQQTGACEEGTIGFAWHEVLVARRGSTVEWAIDGIRLATISNATFTASNVFVGYWDMFASLSDNTNLSFGVVDNVRVEVPAVAPAIPLPLAASLVVTQGASVTFCITATGSVPLTYQWQKNGQNLAGATGSCYTRTAVQPADAGTYSVVVSNAAGAVSSSTELSVVVPPPQPGHFDSLARLPDGTLRLNMSGAAGSNYLLEYTSDWVTWSNLCTLSGPDGLFWTIDPSITNAPRRFYRLRLLP